MKIRTCIATIVGLGLVSTMVHSEPYMDSTFRVRPLETYRMAPAPETPVVAAPHVADERVYFGASHHDWKPQGLRDLERLQRRLELRLQAAKWLLENRRKQSQWRYHMRKIATKLEMAKRWRA